MNSAPQKTKKAVCQSEEFNRSREHFVQQAPADASFRTGAERKKRQASAQATLRRIDLVRV
jgi:hypothetical protein